LAPATLESSPDRSRREGMRFFFYSETELILSRSIMSSAKANAPTYQACGLTLSAYAYACSDALSLQGNTASPNKATVSSPRREITAALIASP
jgi:hypothetical protein